MYSGRVSRFRAVISEIRRHTIAGVFFGLPPCGAEFGYLLA